ncbi:MAG TPA: aspartyl-phosphate phosphatase Spo0E family protein [Bacillota bacterium]
MLDKHSTRFDNYQMAATLEKEITLARRMMEKLWNERGYTDKAVLDASIKVDTLLNRYEQLKENDIIY